VEHSPAVLSVAALAWDEVLILLLPLPLIAAANWNLAPPAGSGILAVTARLLGAIFWGFLALVPAISGIVGLLTFLTLPLSPRSPVRLGAYAVILLGTGILGGVLLAPAVRRWLSSFLPLDAHSPLDAAALVLTVALVGTQLANQLAVDVLVQQAQTGVALAPIDLVAQELPFLIAAFLGVGLFIRRSPRTALERLGFVRPAGWQVLLALAAAGVFYAFGAGVDALAHSVTPGLAHQVDAANQRLFGQLGDPVGIATIALSAGICEEALFRGALQPRLGVLWTALVFAAVHTQYGLSLDAAAVFVLAIGLGLLRRIANTITTTICHVAYNTLVGVGVGGPWLVPALAVEAGLILASAAAFLTGKLGRLRTAP
jgi:membrane protease YdiL (CAAX protease family)